MTDRRRSHHRATCRACSKDDVVRDNLCARCLDDLPLTGGSWVKDERGVKRWQPWEGADA